MQGHDLVVKNRRSKDSWFRGLVVILAGMAFLVLGAFYSSNSQDPSLLVQQRVKGSKKLAGGPAPLQLSEGEPASVDIIIGRNDRMIEDQQLLASLQAESQQVSSELAGARKESLALVEQQVDVKRKMLQLLARQRSLVQDMGKVSRSQSFAEDTSRAVRGETSLLPSLPFCLPFLPCCKSALHTL
eukprot:241710-Hanusia_phi.AAC.1